MSLFILISALVAPVLTLSFSSYGQGIGFSTDDSAFALSSSFGDVKSAGTAASGGMVNSVTTVIGGSAQSGSVMESPSAREFSMDNLIRPVQEVPDYGASVPKRKVKVKVKVKKAEESYTGPDTSNAAYQPKTCWTYSKTCCYEQVHKGYECKDFYVYKYARCHPVIDYEEICGEIKEHPQQHPKPEGYVAYEDTIIKNYDSRYGPHVQGYPSGGESEYYKTSHIPQKPYGVSGEPTEPSYTAGNSGAYTPHASPAVYSQTSSGQTYQTGPSYGNGGGYTGAGKAQGSYHGGTAAPSASPIPAPAPQPETQQTSYSGGNGESSYQVGGTYRSIGELRQGLDHRNNTSGN